MGKRKSKPLVADILVDVPQPDRQRLTVRSYGRALQRMAKDDPQKFRRYIRAEARKAKKELDLA